jgi:hypothetical protein
MMGEQQLRRRIRGLVWLFIAGLVVSGVTAIPLEWELNLLVKLFGAEQAGATAVDAGFAPWLLKVREGVSATNIRYPFMAYGTDWLAFGHVVIAIAFAGAVRDPVRNAWLFDFGLIACGLVIPWALVFGSLRGIPFGWQLIDCSFGACGFIPLWIARGWTRELRRLTARRET